MTLYFKYKHFYIIKAGLLVKGGLMKKVLMILGIIFTLFLISCTSETSVVSPGDTIDDDVEKEVEEETEIEEEVEEEVQGETEESLEQTEETSGITPEELAKHNTEGDCWIVYEGKVYDYSQAPSHANMAKTFYRHCGQISGYEEGAKARHSGSSAERVERYGPYIGDLEQ